MIITLVSGTLIKTPALSPLYQQLAAAISINGRFTNLKAFKKEEGAEDWRVFPHIYFAANNFEFYGIPGDFSSWQSFGKWIKKPECRCLLIKPGA